jgi:PAS domain S-box-containing protein
MTQDKNHREEADRLKQRIAELEATAGSAGPLPVMHEFFDAMFEGVQVIDFDFRYVYLNETAASQGRQDKDALVGRRMDEMYPGIEASEFWGVLKACLERREHQQMVNHFTYPDGRRGWFDLRLSPVPQGALILSFDISVQKNLEEELRRSREDLALTLDCMDEAVITTDVDGQVRLVNPSAEILCGMPGAQAVGRPLDETLRLLNDETLVEAQDLVGDILSRGLKRGMANHTLLQGRDGQRRPVASSGAPMRDAEGKLRGAVLVFKDMSGEKELRDRLDQAQRLEAIGRLAGGIAHDFNNLITVINGHAELLLETLRDGAQRKDVETIRQAGDRAAELTRQLLAFSRRQILQPKVLDLNEAAASATGLLRRTLGENIDLVLRQAPDLDRVKVDPGQLQQIIVNLALNARDAMPHGGKLTLETANVVLDADYAAAHAEAAEGPHVMLAVTDTGEGMEADVKARIFEPFFTTKGQGRGTGLGLATVHGIVRQSGGNIWVYSEPGRGTCFKVYRPSVREQAYAAAAEAPAPAPMADASLLLVEDEAGVRELLETVLRRGGYRVRSAANAEAALDLIRASPDGFQILLTDVVLPGVNGRRLADEALRLLPDLKVVYMSGYTDNAIVHQGVLDPGTAFIEKPVSPAVLLRKLREFTGRD